MTESYEQRTLTVDLSDLHLASQENVRIQIKCFRDYANPAEIGKVLDPSYGQEGLTNSQGVVSFLLAPSNYYQFYVGDDQESVMYEVVIGDRISNIFFTMPDADSELSTILLAQADTPKKLKGARAMEQLRDSSDLHEEEDPHIEVKSGLSLIPVELPTGRTKTWNLDRWTLSNRGLNFSSLIAEFDTEEEITAETLFSSPDIAALFAWLNSIRTGDELGSSLAQTSWQGRYFTANEEDVTPGADGWYFSFALSEVFITYQGGILQRIVIYAGVYTNPPNILNGGYSFSRFNEIIRAARPVISGPSIMTPPFFGDYRVPIRSSELRLGSGALISAHGQLPLLQVASQKIPFPYGRVVNFDELPGGGGQTRRIPLDIEIPVLSEIVFNETRDTSLSLISPNTANTYSGTVRPIVIRNTGNNKLSLNHWSSGNTLCVIYPKQIATLNYYRDNNGLSELSIDIEPRLHIMDGSRGEAFITSYWREGNNWYRLIDEVPAERNDNDGFNTLSTDGQERVNSYRGNLTHGNFTYVKGILRIQQTGKLTVNQVATVGVEGNTNAGLIAPYRTRIYIKRGTNLSYIDNNWYDPWDVAHSKTRNHTFFIEGYDVQAGDLLSFGIWFPVGDTVNTNNLNLQRIRRHASLKPDLIFS